jgi:hypothetical protein
VSERGRARARACVCVCVCVSEREREREKSDRAREREREHECVCARECMCVYRGFSPESHSHAQTYIHSAATRTFTLAVALLTARRRRPARLSRLVLLGGFGLLATGGTRSRRIVVLLLLCVPASPAPTTLLLRLWLTWRLMEVKMRTTAVQNTRIEEEHTRLRNCISDLGDHTQREDTYSIHRYTAHTESFWKQFPISATRHHIITL